MKLVNSRVSSINYDFPSHSVYYWRLEGSSYNEWVQLNSNSLIRFTNLSPGNYKLYVRAISKEEPSIVFEERQVEIIIAQPVWFSGDLRSGLVQGCHGTDGGCHVFRGRLAHTVCGAQQPHTQRFGQQQLVSRLAGIVCVQMMRIHKAGHRQAVFDTGVCNGMTSYFVVT